jgi:antitoxin ParD1/3/4
METDTMNVALPRNLKEYVQEQVSLGGYSSVSEYLRELIRADQKSKAKEALESEILKGLNSGEATPMTADDWQDLRQEIVKRHSLRKNGTR